MSSQSDQKKSYQFIKNILLHVQDLSKEEQILYVKKSCTTRPELIPSLLNMLDIGNSEFAEVMEKPAILEHIPEIDSSLAIAPELPAGTNISHYTIINKIGSGGMGHVYAAKQKYPAERKVALKLLKNTPNQQLIITETQILARLNHPNIATLFEIDKSQEGQYFIAMEFIKGNDIISWCKRHSYSQTQTITLFQQLCAGISYAHEQHIIHCDIKPNNVMVTMIDGHATVKIIDFGISQFEDQKDSYLDISGTPAYLAPEVVAKNNQSISDALRDVYALGVLLRNLLPATLPIDLQAIINKASAHDRQQRYASPSDLNNDLSRYLSKKTVSARNTNVWYVTKLLIQRRFELVLAVILITIFSLGSGYVAQTKQAEIARQQAKAAKAAQKEAEELSGFLTDLFNVANPERSNQKIITAVDLLDKAQDKLIALENPGLSDAHFMHTIGSIYTRMDRLKDAQTLIENSLNIKKAQLEENNNGIVVGNIQLGLIHKKLGAFDQAEKLLLAAMKSLNKHSNPNTVQLAYIHNHLGNLYTETGQIIKSIEQHQFAIKLRLQDADTKLLADSYNNLGVIYQNNKQWDLASQYFHLALDIFTIKYTENHPYIGVVKNNLALIEFQRFNWNLAEKLSIEAFENWQKSYGDDHINTITAQRNLALFYDMRMQYNKAAKLFNRLIKHFEATNNAEKLAKYTSLSGLTHARMQQFTKASEYHLRSLDLISNIQLKEKSLYAKIYNQYAKTLILQGDFETAEQQIKQSLIYLESTYAMDNHNRLFTLNMLAEMFYQKGDNVQSTENFQLVLSLDDPKNVRNQLRQIVAYIGLGKIYKQQDLLQESEASFNQALLLNKKTYGDNHKNNAVIYYELAQLNILQGHSAQAKKLLNQSLEIQQRALPAQHKDLLATITLIKAQQ